MGEMISEICILNRFRDDAVYVTHQNSSGFIDSHCVDFPKIKDRKKQLLIALAEELGLVDDEWCKDLYDMVEQNNKDIEEELNSIDKEVNEMYERMVGNTVQSESSLEPLEYDEDEDFESDVYEEGNLIKGDDKNE